MNLFPNYQRIVHLNDIVPHLPMIAMGFNHAGDEIWYNQANNAEAYIICQNKPSQPENK